MHLPRIRARLQARFARAEVRHVAGLSALDVATIDADATAAVLRDVSRVVSRLLHSPHTDVRWAAAQVERAMHGLCWDTGRPLATCVHCHPVDDPQPQPDRRNRAEGVLTEDGQWLLTDDDPETTP